MQQVSTSIILRDPFSSQRVGSLTATGTLVSQEVTATFLHPEDWADNQRRRFWNLRAARVLKTRVPKSVTVTFSESDGFAEIYQFLITYFSRPIKRHFVSTFAENADRMSRSKNRVSRSLKNEVQSYLDTDPDNVNYTSSGYASLQSLKDGAVGALFDTTRNRYLRDRISSLREAWLSEFRDSTQEKNS